MPLVRLGDHRGDLPPSQRRPLLLRSAQQLDYPVVQSVNLIIAAMVVGLNLLIDLSYAFWTRGSVSLAANRRSRRPRSALRWPSPCGYRQYNPGTRLGQMLRKPLGVGSAIVVVMLAAACSRMSSRRTASRRRACRALHRDERRALARDRSASRDLSA
jgi:hypothetical protein